MSDSDHETDEDLADGAGAEAGESEFSAFIMSLATSALMHMGEVHEESEQPHVDLDMARHTIDIIGMLHGKTRGNLNSEETRVVESALYDLRLRFVEARKKAGGTVNRA